jgi:geranylgeranyl reductase family protein
MAENYDVIIAGAGPGGSSTAALLARAGARVLLLDKATFPREKACGEYTSPETGRVLARLGALEWIEREARPRHVRAMKIFGPGGAGTTIDYRWAGTDGDVLATPRGRLDAALVVYAVQTGAILREGARVLRALVEDGQVVGVAARTPGGAEETIRAPLVIGADGGHSAIVRSLGLGREVRWPRKLGLVARYEGVRLPDDAGEMHTAPHGYVGLAPLADGLVNVGYVQALPAAPDGIGTEARFLAGLARFPLLAERLEGARRVTPIRGVGPIAVQVRRVAGAGFLLVGDAAGFFDPFTGEGVYKALRGAELAAAVALPALAAGDLSARALDRYRALRRREFFAKDLVCRIVQIFVQQPAMMDYVVARLARRAPQRRVLAGVLGDFTDARAALHPGYLWGLLRP